MYVTRPLSLLRKFPNALLAPPEGPNSGYLVIQDEEAVNTCCFRRCEDTWIYELPFPQDKHLTIEYRTGGGARHKPSSSTTYRDNVVLIPVLNEPLSSNRYYAIQPHGRHKGEAFANSKREDMPSLFFHLVRDADPAPLHPYDPYQQFVIYSYETMFDSGRFYARSVAQDGYPPRFLERKGWKIYWKTPKSFCLDDAPGIDGLRRELLPTFDFPIARARSDAVVVGKWYCPFMFVKDGTVGDQINKSMYYGMSLEQRWERIHTLENENVGKGGCRVTVDVVIQNEVVSVAGTEAVDANVADGVLWWRSVCEGRGENRVGLSLAIVERMKWEEKRVGWVNGDEKHHVKVNRVEEFGGAGEWKRFGCYVLVERFVLRRMDGSVVLTYEFKHPHQLRNKWE